MKTFCCVLEMQPLVYFHFSMKIKVLSHKSLGARRTGNKKKEAESWLLSNNYKYFLAIGLKQAIWICCGFFLLLQYENMKRCRHKNGSWCNQSTSSLRSFCQSYNIVMRWRHKGLIITNILIDTVQQNVYIRVCLWSSISEAVLEIMKTGFSAVDMWADWWADIFWIINQFWSLFHWFMEKKHLRIWLQERERERESRDVCLSPISFLFFILF